MCTNGTYFLDLKPAKDVGTLQRLQRAVGAIHLISRPVSTELKERETQVRAKRQSINNLNGPRKLNAENLHRQIALAEMNIADACRTAEAAQSTIKRNEEMIALAKSSLYLMGFRQEVEAQDGGGVPADQTVLRLVSPG
jgi:hypothetical protein